MNNKSSILGKRRGNVSSIEPCSLTDYRRIVADLGRPSSEQIENYVHFVSEAHSWYKHLPLLPPGATFRFLVDPFSGYDSHLQPGGRVIHEERTNKSQRFHYTWMTTAEYRSRFGYLDYESTAIAQCSLDSTGTIQEYEDLSIFSTSEGLRRVPPELVLAGSVEITAVIHPLTARTWVWNDILPRQIDDSPDGSTRMWPTETGGNETLRKIMDVCAQPPYADLDMLLLPERKRLQSNMSVAINRMLDLLYQDDNGGA